MVAGSLIRVDVVLLTLAARPKKVSLRDKSAGLSRFLTKPSLGLYSNSLFTRLFSPANAKEAPNMAPPDGPLEGCRFPERRSSLFFRKAYFRIIIPWRTEPNDSLDD